MLLYTSPSHDILLQYYHTACCANQCVYVVNCYSLRHHKDYPQSLTPDITTRRKSVAHNLARRCVGMVRYNYGFQLILIMCMGIILLLSVIVYDSNHKIDDNVYDSIYDRVLLYSI